jgi:hypothetical protein
MVVEIEVAGFPFGSVPTEYQPPLLVNPYRAEAVEIAPQFFEMVARRHTQILIRHGIINHLQLAKQSAFYVRRDFLRVGVVDEKTVKPLVSKAGDHPSPLNEPMYHSLVQNVNGALLEQEGSQSLLDCQDDQK